MHFVPEVTLEHGLSQDRIRQRISEHFGKTFVAAKLERVVVYAVRHQGRTLYVGCGTVGRAYSWLYPKGYKSLGVEYRPTLWLIKTGLTQDQAWKLEAECIAEWNPPFNKARFKNSGGLPVWNVGLKGDKRCRGGRPPGIPTTAEQKARLSEALKGKAGAWMTGRPAWNKGLTKADPRVAAGVSTYDKTKRQQAAEKTWKKRRDK